VKDDVESGLEIVLGLIKKSGVDPVEFAANGETGMQAVVKANAGLCGKSVAAVAGRLGLKVCAADERVGPRLEAVAAPADAESATAAEIFYVFILEDRGREASDEVALDSEPAVGEIANRGVGADEAGVDDAGLKAVKTGPEGQLPAVIVAIAINKIGFGSRRGWRGTGVRSRRRRFREATRLADGGVDQVDLSGAGVAEGGGDIFRAAFCGRGDTCLLRADGARRRQDDRHSQDWLLHTDCPPPLVTAPPRRRGVKLPGQRIITRPPEKVSQRSCAAKLRGTR
jgi:hypothetical protein